MKHKHCSYEGVDNLVRVPVSCTILEGVLGIANCFVIIFPIPHTCISQCYIRIYADRQQYNSVTNNDNKIKSNSL